MTRKTQPGQNEGSKAGRLAVNFKGIVLQSFTSEDRRAVPPSDATAPHKKMNSQAPVRLCLGAAFALLLAAAPALAQTRKQLAPDPAPQRVQPREQRPELRAPEGSQNSELQREGHLQRWMQSHANMSLAEQQRELQNQPGFRELPPETQRNQLNTLARLYYMNPQQRSRILDRTEALERLGPGQRQQWRDAVQRLNMLPQPRRHMMAGAIIELRELPPEQRDAVLESPAYRAQFSPDERQTLRTLLMAEPYPAVRTFTRPPYPPPPVP
jgi:hypothetical protein